MAQARGVFSLNNRTQGLHLVTFLTMKGRELYSSCSYMLSYCFVFTSRDPFMCKLQKKGIRKIGEGERFSKQEKGHKQF